MINSLNIGGPIYYAYLTQKQLNNATLDQLYEYSISFRKAE